MYALINKYNNETGPDDQIDIDDAISKGGDNQRFQLPCRIVIVSNSTDLKFEKKRLDYTVMMEYEHFFKLLAMYLPPGPLKDNQKGERIPSERE